MEAHVRVVRLEGGPNRALSEYERLGDLAESEGKPLDEVLREAVRAYADAHAPPDPDDPPFAVEAPAGGEEGVSAADADEYLYGTE